jgi:hypothetical protein
MRTLIACGILALASIVSLTTANAQGGYSGSLVSACKPGCGVPVRFATSPPTPSERACIAKCVAAKKAAQR